MLLSGRATAAVVNYQVEDFDCAGVYAWRRAWGIAPNPFHCLGKMGLTRARRKRP